MAAADKQQQAALIQQSLESIGSIHREEFPAATKPMSTAPALTPYLDLLAAYERQELKGLSWFARKRRAAAKTRARGLADAYARHLMSQAAGERASEAERIDAAWTRLMNNDPDEVLAALAAAFEDNEAPAAPVGVEGAEAHLVVLVPADDVIPDRQPSITQAGNLSLRKMTKTTTAQWHRELVAGHVLASVKEAFAVAPGLQAGRVIAVQSDGAKTQDKTAVPILAVRVDRSALRSVSWAERSAWEILEETFDGTEVVNVARTTGALRPLDLKAEPEIAEAVRTVAFTED